MPVFKFGVFSTSNLIPDPGPPPSQSITTVQTNGNRQVGDTFTVGTEDQQSIRIEDNENINFEDDTETPQFLTEALTINGVTYPVGTQVQNEFTLVTNQTDVNGDPIEIIVLRFQPPTGDLSTTAYTLTAPLPPGTVIEIVSERDRLTGTNAQEYPDFICFASGTLIKTASGGSPIETLQPGDMVLTLDHGAQPIRWIGRRTMTSLTMMRHPNLIPIRIAAGSLGPQMPKRDLVVSPQHRLFLQSKIAERMFGQSEVLVHAKNLLGLPGIERTTDGEDLIYIHLMCDDHEIICANGTFAETLYTGPEAIKALSPAAQHEIETIFGDMPYLDRPLARPTPKGKVSRKLVARHIKNKRPLILAH